MPAWEPACRQRALWPSVTHGRATQPRRGRSATMVEKRTWVNIAVCPCLHLFLTHSKHHLFENKVWEIYIFIKKCVRSLLKLSLSVNYVPHIFVYVYVQLYVAIQHKTPGKWLKTNEEFNTKAIINLRMCGTWWLGTWVLSSKDRPINRKTQKVSDSLFQVWNEKGYISSSENSGNKYVHPLTSGMLAVKECNSWEFWFLPMSKKSHRFGVNRLTLWVIYAYTQLMTVEGKKQKWFIHSSSTKDK